MKKHILIFTGALMALTVLSSCTTKREKAVQLDAALKIDALQKQVAQLQTELDKKERELNQTKDTEKELNNLVVQAYNHENYEDLFMFAGTAITLYPNSQSYNAFYNYFNTAKNYLGLGGGSTAALTSYQDYSSETGIWKISHFLDSFGQETSTPYITTSSLITGSFTDKNFTNAFLQVYPIISSENSISFMLYELGGEAEVKGSKRSPVSYDVTVKDGNGINHNFKATNNSDRAAFDRTASQKINQILKDGGYIQFVLKTTKDGYTSTYKFNLQDSSFYSNACRQLYSQQH